MPEKIFPVEFGGYWELASDYTYDSISFLDSDKFKHADEFAHEVAKRYNDYHDLKNTLYNALSQLTFCNDTSPLQSTQQAIINIEKLLDK